MSTGEWGADTAARLVARWRVAPEAAEWFLTAATQHFAFLAERGVLRAPVISQPILAGTEAHAWQLDACLSSDWLECLVGAAKLDSLLGLSLPTSEGVEQLVDHAPIRRSWSLKASQP